MPQECDNDNDYTPVDRDLKKASNLNENCGNEKKTCYRCDCESLTPNPGIPTAGWFFSTSGTECAKIECPDYVWSNLNGWGDTPACVGQSPVAFNINNPNCLKTLRVKIPMRSKLLTGQITLTLSDVKINGKLLIQGTSANDGGQLIFDVPGGFSSDISSHFSVSYGGCQCPPSSCRPGVITGTPTYEYIDPSDL